MKPFLFMITIGMVLVLSESANAQQQCAPMNSNVPFCPSSGVRVLDESYPMRTFVAPTPHQGAIIESPPTEIAAVTVMTAYSDLTQVPNIFIPATGPQCEIIKTNIRNRLLEKGTYSVATIDQAFMSRVSCGDHTNAPYVSFQQDAGQSTFDATTGRSVLVATPIIDVRRFGGVSLASEIARKSGVCASAADDPSYRLPRVREEPSCGNRNFTAFEESQSVCPRLDPPYSAEELRQKELRRRARRTSYSGGNIEGAPGGLCLVGDTQHPEYSQAFCGSEENTIRIEADWLHVGHVDEIVKIVPSNFADNRPAECRFSVMLASPRKALQLLRANSIPVNRPFFPTHNIDGTPSRSYIGVNLSKILCDDIIRRSRENSTPNRAPTSGGARSADIIWRHFNIFPRAHAQVERRQLCTDEVMQATTNAQFLAIFEDEQNHLVRYNNLVQEAMDRNAKKIREKILGRLPQCAPFYASMEWEVPSLFHAESGSITSTDGKDGLNRATGTSILPNPTNGVLANRTLIFSKPHAQAFEDNIKQETSRRGLVYAEVDTFGFSHDDGGNLHCLTNTLLECRPRQ